MVLSSRFGEPEGLGVWAARGCPTEDGACVVSAHSESVILLDA